MTYSALYARSIYVALLGALLGMAMGAMLTPLSASAETKPSYQYERLFYYAGGELAKKSFFAHPSTIDVFAPQTYKLASDGSLSGFVNEELLSFAKRHNIRVMPLVTNQGFSRAASKAILQNPLVQDTAIAALILEAKAKNYWGWQVDFEQMDAEDRDLFSAFIRKAGERMKENGLMFSVAVIAQISENPTDYKEGLWQKVIGVYDYSALASSTDFVSIMSYDDPSSKGAVAPYPWFTKVLEFSMQHIPKEKLSLGIPTYYWKWDDITGKRVGIGGNEGIDNVFKLRKVRVSYSAIDRAPALHYWSGGRSYTLWYENARSVREKIALVRKYELRGVSLWTLGLEVPSVHTALKQ